VISTKELFRFGGRRCQSNLQKKSCAIEYQEKKGEGKSYAIQQEGNVFKVGPWRVEGRGTEKWHRNTCKRVTVRETRP